MAADKMKQGTNKWSKKKWLVCTISLKKKPILFFQPAGQSCDIIAAASSSSSLQ